MAKNSNPESGLEKMEKGESPTGGSGATGSKMTLQKAVDLGEYDPEYLATFPEWHTYPRYSQFQLIRTAVENRRKQLLRQWAEINNVLDFSKKPHLPRALKSVEEQLHKVMEDKERLLVEYADGISA